MRFVTVRRVLVAGLVAALNVVVPIQGPVASTLAASTTTFCVEGLYSFYLDAWGSPGEVQTFNVTTVPIGNVEFALTTAGPFSGSLDVPVTIGAGGSGRTTFIARGKAVGSTFLTATDVDSGDLTNVLEITVDRVESISLEPADPGHALDADPRSPEPGALRFFPDLDTPSDDPAASRRLTVKATLELGSDGVNVQFRYADVDDPSTDDSSVDLNGPAGVDNYGQTALSALQATTELGVATVDLSLPMQPGDNVKMVASCAQGYVNGLRIDGRDVKDSQGRTLPTPAAELSDLVTIWRRLWIETDSMGQVSDNFVEGVVASAKEIRVRIDGVATAVTQLKLGSVNDANGNPVGKKDRPSDQFRYGRIQFGQTTPYDVLSSDRNLINIAPGHAGLTGAYTMVDDDNLNGQKDGDQTFDVPLPDLSHLQAADQSGTNWFAAAFIRPMELPGHENVPFYLQGTDDPSDMFCRQRVTPCPANDSSFDNVATEASPTYWTVYLLGAYQPGLKVDADPETEDPVYLGWSDDPNDGPVLGSAVYAETIRDEGQGLGGVCEGAGAAVHEVAHLFGAMHSTGIMAANCVDGSTSFSPQSLGAIRSALHP